METPEHKINPESRQENFLARFYGWVKQVFKKIYLFFKSRHTEPAKPDNTHNAEPLNAIKQSLEEEFRNYEGNVTINGIEKEFILSAKFMLSSGFSDGVDGIPAHPRGNDIIILASSRAAKLYHMAQAIVSGRLIKTCCDLFGIHSMANA